MSKASEIPRIVLYQFGSSKKFAPLPTFDPFCLSAQAYLKFAGVPFTENNCNNPNASPVNKLPVLAINSEKTVVHTEIVHELSQMGYNLDHGMSQAELAEIQAWKSLVEESLYNCQLYNWFSEKTNFDEVTNLVFSRALPFPLNWILPSRYRKSVNTKLELHGLISADAAYSLAKKCYHALSTKLGNRKFFFGDEPTSLDAVVFGFLATQLIPELPNRELHFLISEHQNLVQFVNNILNTYFNESNPVIVDYETAHRWLQAQKEAKKLTKETSDALSKSISSSWAIAIGIGITVLFAASQNVQFRLLHNLITSKYFSNDKPSKTQLKFLSSSNKTQDDDDDDYDDDDYEDDEDELLDGDQEPFHNINPFLRNVEASAYVGDDGQPYDWDEGYLEEMETGSDLPEDHEDLGDDEDD